MEAPDFWNDNQKAQRLISEMKLIKSSIGEFPIYEQQGKDLHEFLQFAEAEKDEATGEQLKADAAKLNDVVKAYELKALMTGKNDHRNAFVTFQSGAGGDDAADWAEILMRMYVRWAEHRGFKVTFFDVDFNEAAGIKSAILKIE